MISRWSIAQGSIMVMQIGCLRYPASSVGKWTGTEVQRDWRSSHCDVGSWGLGRHHPPPGTG